MKSKSFGGDEELNFDSNCDSLSKDKSEKSTPKLTSSNLDENIFHQQATKKPVGLTFFRFSHRDKNEKPLTNKQQAAIVDNIYQKIYCMTEHMEDHQYSSTHVPYYDSLINNNSTAKQFSKESLKKKARAFDKIHEEAGKENKIIVEERSGPPQILLSVSIPTFSPFSKEEKSNIISETQAIMIGRLLPPIIRMQQWNRLYSIDVDGVSLSTFYKNLKSHTATILLIQDQSGYKFGAYVSSDWVVKKYFYGTGESFLFTFKDTEEDMKVYRWTGINENIQYSNEKEIALGGHQGTFALYLRKNFYFGTSHK